MTRRLILSYLTVTMFVLIVLEVPFAGLVADRQRRELVTGLERDALILATIYEDALDRNAPYSPTPALDYAEESGTRVVVVDVDGRSIVDTVRNVNDDFSNRQEIARALSGEIASGTRRSEDLGRDLLFVAVPVASGGRIYGAVRITADPADVEATIHRFWWTLAGVAVVVLAAMALVGWVIARSITRPIVAVRDAAVRAGSGDLDVAIEIGDAPPELSELVHRFNEMAGRLSDLIDRQRSFVGDASHQLRTPLTGLRLRLENLEAMVDSDALPEVEGALAEVERLGRLVEQLLTLARAEDAPIEPEPVDLTELVAERGDLWAAVAAEHGISISCHGTHDGPVMGLALPGALDQILDNLIDNALSVAPDGSQIVVGVEPGRSRHRVRVTDSGPGMTEEEMQRAFDRFWRSDTSTAGTGLGLAIVRRLAEASGGSAWLEAADGGGLAAVVEVTAG
ncbi:MAG: ATP-binding protein [Acidimicrobiia bacterium]|nr:ATP-binding protein [Acidimicrobiia bacterium]